MDACSQSIVRTLRRATVFVIVVAIPAAASAVCTGLPITFSQSCETCPGMYSYVVSPSGASPQSLVGSFWALGYGDPAQNAGTDNGAFAADDGWIFTYIAGPAILGSWSQSNEIDGCIDGKIAPGKNAEIMVVEFSDSRVSDSYSDFAVAAVSRHASSSPQFDFAVGIGTDIYLSPLPKPGIVSSAQVGLPVLEIGVRGPTAVQLLPGFYSDGSTGIQEVISGYRLYIAQHDNTNPPSVLRDAGWAPLSGTVPLGEIATVTYECTSIYQNLAYSLVYESGFESRYLSQRSTLIKCELCFQNDGDGDNWPSPMLCGRLDCDNTDRRTHPGANEFNDGRDNQCPGDLGFGVIDEISGVFGFKTPDDKNRLSWPEQEGATSYQVARSTDPAFATDCVVFNTFPASITDTAVPPPQLVFHYLVRPTAPLTGSWGSNSAGVERSTVCP